MLDDDDTSRPPNGTLPYRLLTGTDDRAFCERVSKALEEGWVLHGSPCYAYDDLSKQMRTAQAVVWPGYAGPGQ